MFDMACAAGNTMAADDFTREVVPAISKLFASSDRSIRRSLLESIDTYGKNLTEVGAIFMCMHLPLLATACSLYHMTSCKWCLPLDCA